jgi:two-component sensor histidine kinase
VVTPKSKIPLWPKELSLRSLRGRMALLFGVLLLPAGALAVHSGATGASLRIAAAQREVGAEVLRAMNAHRDKVTRLREIASTVAATTAISSLTGRACNSALSTLSNRFQEIEVVAIVDSGARISCASNPAVVGRISVARDLVEVAATRDGVAIGFLTSSSLLPGSLVAAVAPLAREGPGRAQFAMVARDSRPLMTRTSGAASLAGGYAALSDADGNVLEVEGLAADSEELAALTRRLAQGDIRSRLAPFHVRTSWAVVSELEDDSIFLVHGWRAAPPTLGKRFDAVWAMIAPVLMWLVAIGAVWIGVKVYVTTPLLTLGVLARSYARGEEPEASNGSAAAPEEISALRRTLQAMAKSLRKREADLADALQKERVLLREVNHRVKNNLQMVASILAIQARSSEDEPQRWGLSRVRDRVQLLALAYSRIYESSAVQDIALDELAGDIGRTLLAARGYLAANVRLKLKLAPVRASVEIAVPMAFLMGESLSQALDMLSGVSAATIEMSLEAFGEDGCVFTVTSPEQGQVQAVTPTARRMIEAFARQLGADVEYDPERPFFTRIRVRKIGSELLEPDPRLGTIAGAE